MHPFTSMAGCESLGWHPLAEGFIVVGRKLEKLGFTYYKGKITIVEPLEESSHA